MRATHEILGTVPSGSDATPLYRDAQPLPLAHSKGRIFAPNDEE